MSKRFLSPNGSFKECQLPIELSLILILQGLFLILYKSFTDVLAEPLQETEGSLRPSSVEADEMTIENEDTAAMEVDKEGGKSENRCVVLKFSKVPTYCIVLIMVWCFNFRFSI